MSKTIRFKFSCTDFHVNNPVFDVNRNCTFEYKNTNRTKVADEAVRHLTESIKHKIIPMEHLYQDGSELRGAIDQSITEIDDDA